MVLKSLTFRCVGLAALLLLAIIGQAYGGEKSIGVVATGITSSFGGLGKLIIAASYLAGFGLTLASIFKFKAHKDNPQQVPMGTPIALLVIGILLVFLPSLFGPAGETVFGGDQKAGGFSGGAATEIEKGGAS